THRPWTTTEEAARDTVDESNYQQISDMNRATRPVMITEHYIELDYEGNGDYAIYRITTGETNDILTRDGEDMIIREDMVPFAAITPVIMPHRFWGKSVADLVMDIQRIKSVLVRGLLDNLYLRNNFRTEVAESLASDN